MMKFLLVLYAASLLYVTAFRINRLPGLECRASTPNPPHMFPSTDNDLGIFRERLSLLARDPVNGKIARDMIERAMGDSFWRELHGLPAISFMPPDASIDKSAASIKSLFDLLYNQTMPYPSVAHIREEIGAFIHNSQSSSEVKLLRDQLQSALAKVDVLMSNLQSTSSNTPCTKWVAPKVYETVVSDAGDVSRVSSPPPFATLQERLQFLRDTWHLRRHIEEVAQAEEIQKILSKSKPLDLNDWYNVNPPGYY